MSKVETTSEQRAHPRVYLPVDAGVYVQSDQGNVLGPVRVIGAGGLFFQTESPFSIGAAKALRLSEAQHHTSHPIQAIIRHVDKIGVGVQFLQLQPEAQAGVERLVNQYLLAP
jgi:hypothetical protein